MVLKRFELKVQELVTYSMSRGKHVLDNVRSARYCYISVVTLRDICSLSNMCRESSHEVGRIEQQWHLGDISGPD